MEKWLCWGALGVSGSLLILFVLDMVIAEPFGGMDRLLDIWAAIGSGLLFLLSLNALREVR